MYKYIYVDLDGVLSNFDKKIIEIFGKLPDLTSNDIWKKIAKYSNFYGSLEMLPDAQELWNYIQPFRPIILTGAPIGDWPKPQKISWVHKHLGEGVPVIVCKTKDKFLFSFKNTLLIDDRYDKCGIPWESKGGKFIHHRNAKQTITELQKLGY